MRFFKLSISGFQSGCYLSRLSQLSLHCNLYIFPIAEPPLAGQAGRGAQVAGPDCLGRPVAARMTTRCTCMRAGVRECGGERDGGRGNKAGGSGGSKDRQRAKKVSMCFYLNGRFPSFVFISLWWPPYYEAFVPALRQETGCPDVGFEND